MRATKEVQQTTQDWSKFNVYHMDYTDLYKKKIIDESEYLEKRFKFF